MYYSGFFWRALRVFLSCFHSLFFFIRLPSFWLYHTHLFWNLLFEVGTRILKVSLYSLDGLRLFSFPAISNSSVNWITFTRCSGNEWIIRGSDSPWQQPSSFRCFHSLRFASDFLTFTYYLLFEIGGDPTKDFLIDVLRRYTSSVSIFVPVFIFGLGSFFSKQNRRVQQSSYLLSHLGGSFRRVPPC